MAERRVGLTIDVNSQKLTSLKREILENERALKQLKAQTKDNIGAQKAAAGQFAKLEGNLKKLRQEYGQVQKEAVGLKSTMLNTPLSQIRTNFLQLAAGITAVVATIRSLTRGWGASIESFRAQEQAIAQLNTALGGNGGLTDSLVEYAEGLQKTTTFGDEQIIQAEALIAAFVDEEEQIKELTRLTLDFAAAKQVDLKTAADLITKTFASSTNALSRYGFTGIDAAAGSTERLIQLTEKLDSAFKGQAETLAQTTSGQLQQYENLIDDVREEIGERLLPATLSLTKAKLALTKALVPLIDVMAQFKELVIALVGAGVLGGLVTAIGALRKSMIALTATSATLRGTLGALFGPAGLIVAGAAALVGLERAIMGDGKGSKSGVVNAFRVLKGEGDELVGVFDEINTGVINTQEKLDALNLAAGIDFKALEDFANKQKEIIDTVALSAKTLKELREEEAKLNDELEELVPGTADFIAKQKELDRVQNRIAAALGKSTDATKKQKEAHEELVKSYKKGFQDLLKLEEQLEFERALTAQASAAFFDDLNAKLEAAGISPFKIPKPSDTPPPDLESAENEWISLGERIAKWISDGITGANPGEVKQFTEDQAAEVEQIIQDSLRGLVELEMAFVDSRTANIRRELDVQLEAIDAKESAILDSEERTSEEQEAIRRQFDKRREAAEAAAARKQKRLLIAQTLAKGAVAGIQALSNTTLPFPASLTALIPIALETAAALAAINAQVFKEGGELPKAAQGKVINIGGRSHAQGGTQIALDGVPVAEAERDEGMFILKKSAMNEIRALSALNVRHGGRPLTPSVPRGTYAQGGQVMGGFDTDALNRFIDSKIARIQVVNNALDTVNKAQSVVNIQTEASF